MVKNLSRYHREHEKYYSEAPLADALSLQRTARTLIALAERWTSAEPAAEPAPSPYAGTPDLNDDRAIETSGVLFMEGEGEPAEISRIKAELETITAGSEQTGSWLAAAMEASWAVAEALLAYPQLADLLGERHRIIGNNWQNACTAQLIARYLRAGRHGDGTDRLLTRRAAQRPGRDRSAAGYLYAAAKLINHAADLSAASSVLTHEDNADGGSSANESSRSPRTSAPDPAVLPLPYRWPMRVDPRSMAGVAARMQGPAGPQLASP